MTAREADLIAYEKSLSTILAKYKKLVPTETQASPSLLGDITLTEMRLAEVKKQLSHTTNKEK